MKPTTIIIGLVIVAIFAFQSFYVYGTADAVEFTVDSKERVCSSNGETTSCKYLVFSQTETLENTDSLLMMKFNSADIHGSLEVGKSYRAQVYGWRVPFLSMYRNITTIQEISE